MYHLWIKVREISTLLGTLNTKPHYYSFLGIPISFENEEEAKTAALAMTNLEWYEIHSRKLS